MRTLKKLTLLVQEKLPVRCRIFFIYTHKNGFDRFNNGLKANTEISYWCFSALKKVFPSVKFLKFTGEQPSRIASIRPQDVVVGHIGPTFLEASRYTKKLIVFNPWAGHEERSKTDFNCALHEDEMRLFNRCASLVLLTSEYNKMHYLEQPNNYWHSFFQDFQKTRRLRIVHQPIDLNLFPRIKWEYQTDNFLYIGNDAYMKCVDASISLVKSLGKELSLYGFGGRKIDHLNTGQVKKLTQEADFFIQPGMWEAQCVSILEAAARGFIPIVSPETGYPYSHPFLLRYNDNAYNLTVLRNLLATSHDERRALADSLHQQLSSDIQHNHWKTLTKVLVEEVRHLYHQRIEI